MIIFSKVISHRLSYIADFFSRQLTGQPVILTDQPDEYLSAGLPRLNYSHEQLSAEEIWIRPHTLLFETGIRSQDTVCSDFNDCRIFFVTGGDLPFDPLAAGFYLLSRYEEYLSSPPDEFGRYHHRESLAFREGFLDKPMVEYWIRLLRIQLHNKFPEAILHQPKFQFLPTYDIDEAYAYRYKSWWRSAGAATRDLLTFRFGNFVKRRNVIDQQEPDPYDAFSWMDDLHRPHHLQPRYFFLVAARNGQYDKHILPGETAMQTLIARLAEKYPVGLHPSWQTGDEPSLLLQEKETLEKITKLKITASRQHYLRMKIPVTYRLLLEAGIHEDFSMGYGNINGFRASVSLPFFWYDLEKEQQTPLQVFPFCFMEANAYFEQKRSTIEALDEMHYYFRELKKVQGKMVTIWHNTFLGTDPLYRGWREIYAQFVKEVSG